MINKNAVLNKAAMALTAALVVGSASTALAYEKLDSATGLRTEYYYAPLQVLEREGAPINAQGHAYLRQQPVSRSAARGNSYSLVDGGYDARAQVPGSQFAPGPSNWGSPWQHGQDVDATGAPKGPYAFE